MARRPPKAKTLRLLYVRSGNECAFPNCNHPLFDDNGLFIAQLCHIKAANKGGPRYDSSQSEEERNSSANLVFMCYRHHKEIDSGMYSSERLIEMKQKHEARFTEGGREASNEMIRQVLHETQYFWERQSKKTFDFDHLKFDLINELENHIQTVESYCNLCAESDDKLLSDLRQLLKELGAEASLIDGIPYYENPFISRNWEMHNIGRPNFFSHISLCLNQLKVKITDELLKHDPSNSQLKLLAEGFRAEFEDDYDNSYYTD